MSTTKKASRRFRVGDWVAFPFGTRQIKAKIIEDRGPLGVKGRRLYRVQAQQSDPDQLEPETFEVPENELQETEPGFLWPRLVYRVCYIRQPDDSWIARTKREKDPLGDANAKGAVLVATGRWEADSTGQEKHVTVTVFQECDPALISTRQIDHPDVAQAMLVSVRESADRMFHERFPKAVIKHSDGVAMRGSKDSKSHDFKRP